MPRGCLRACGLAIVVVVAAGCGGEDAVLPRVSLIGDAVAAVAADIGVNDPELFEVLADLDGVTVTVAETEVNMDTGEITGRYARSYRYDGELLQGPGDPVAADGAVFVGSAIPTLSNAVFGGVRDALDTPDVVDLAVSGGPDGSVIVDLTVRSERGGEILVLVRPDGTVLGVQAD